MDFVAFVVGQLVVLATCRLAAGVGVQDRLDRVEVIGDAQQHVAAAEEVDRVRRDGGVERFGERVIYYRSSSPWLPSQGRLPTAYGQAVFTLAAPSRGVVGERAGV